VLLEPHPSIAHMTGTTRSIYAPTIDYNDIVPDADAPRLVHLGKERPRLRKAPPAKRPVIACESLLADDGADDVGVNLNQLSLSAPPAVHSPYVVVLCPFLLYIYLRPKAPASMGKRGHVSLAQNIPKLRLQPWLCPRPTRGA